MNDNIIKGYYSGIVYAVVTLYRSKRFNIIHTNERQQIRYMLEHDFFFSEQQSESWANEFNLV